MLLTLSLHGPVENNKQVSRQSENLPQTSPDKPLNGTPPRNKAKRLRPESAADIASNPTVIYLRLFLISQDAHKIHSNSVAHARGSCRTHMNEFKSKYISDEMLLSTFWTVPMFGIS